jgi:hypothetical protein
MKHFAFISKCSMKWGQRDKSKQNYFTSMTCELRPFLKLPAGDCGILSNDQHKKNKILFRVIQRARSMVVGVD